jgi:hypothetical protein
MFTYMKKAISSDQIAAVTEDGDGADGGQGRHPGGHQGVDPGLLVEGVGVGLIDGQETSDLFVFLNHGLNGAYAGQVFLHLGGQVRHAVLHVLGGHTHLVSGPAGVQEHERQWRQQQQGQGWREVEHETEADQGGIDQDHQQDAAHGDQPLDERDVRHRPGHHVADGVAVEKAGALMLQGAVESLAQIESDPDPRAAHQIAGTRDHCEAAQHCAEDAGDRQQQIGVPCGDAVDGDGQQDGHRGLEQTGNAERHNAEG